MCFGALRRPAGAFRGSTSLRALQAAALVLFRGSRHCFAMCGTGSGSPSRSASATASALRSAAGYASPSVSLRGFGSRPPFDLATGGVSLRRPRNPSVSSAAPQALRSCSAIIFLVGEPIRKSEFDCSVFIIRAPLIARKKAGG